MIVIVIMFLLFYANVYHDINDATMIITSFMSSEMTSSIHLATL